MRIINIVPMSVLPTRYNRALPELIGHRYGGYRMGILGSNRLTVPVRFLLPLFVSTCIPLAQCVLGSQHRSSRLYRTLVRSVPSCLCDMTSRRSSQRFDHKDHATVVPGQLAQPSPYYFLGQDGSYASMSSRLTSTLIKRVFMATWSHGSVLIPCLLN